MEESATQQKERTLHALILIFRSCIVISPRRAGQKLFPQLCQHVQQIGEHNPALLELFYAHCWEIGVNFEGDKKHTDWQQREISTDFYAGCDKMDQSIVHHAKQDYAELMQHALKEMEYFATDRMNKHLNKKNNKEN